MRITFSRRRKRGRKNKKRIKEYYDEGFSKAFQGISKSKNLKNKKR